MSLCVTTRRSYRKRDLKGAKEIQWAMQNLKFVWLNIIQPKMYSMHLLHSPAYSYIYFSGLFEQWDDKLRTLAHTQVGKFCCCFQEMHNFIPKCVGSSLPWKELQHINLKFAFSQLHAVEEVYIPFDEKQQICPEVFNAFFCKQWAWDHKLPSFQGVLLC